MRLVFAHALKETAVIALLGYLIGSVGGSVTAPGPTKSEQTLLVSINRADKGDRLPGISMSTSNRSGSSSSATSPALPKRSAFGCVPAFSPIADQAHANIYKRCVA